MPRTQHILGWGRSQVNEWNLHEWNLQEWNLQVVSIRATCCVIEITEELGLQNVDFPRCNLDRSRPFQAASRHYSPSPELTKNSKIRSQSPCSHRSYGRTTEAYLGSTGPRPILCPR